MRSLGYMTLALAACIGLSALPAVAAEGEFAGTANAVKQNVERTHAVIVEISDMATSDEDHKIVTGFVNVQKKLEAQYATLAKSAPHATTLVRLIRDRTNELNRGVRVYNKNCRGRRHSACAKARTAIESLRKHIKDAAVKRDAFRLFASDLLARTTKWRKYLDDLLKKLKEAAADTGPLEELDTNSAMSFGGAEAASASASLDTSAFTAGLTEAAAGASSSLLAVPAGLASETDEEPLTEEATLAPAEPEWRWERVQVKKRFGPFCWTKCCWRRVKIAK